MKAIYNPPNQYWGIDRAEIDRIYLVTRFRKGEDFKGWRGWSHGSVVVCQLVVRCQNPFSIRDHDSTWLLFDTCWNHQPAPPSLALQLCRSCWQTFEVEIKLSSSWAWTIEHCSWAFIESWVEIRWELGWLNWMSSKASHEWYCTWLVAEVQIKTQLLQDDLLLRLAIFGNVQGRCRMAYLYPKSKPA